MATPDNFRVSLGGKTYELSKFLRNHPGGFNTLESFKGKSVLRAMEKFGHGTGAYHMLNDFEVKTNHVIQDFGELSESGRTIVDEKGRNIEEIKLLEELENKLDWSQPILSQLHKVADHYHLWVHAAVDKPCRLFHHPLLERLTFTPWYLVLVVWVPVIVYMTWVQAEKYVFGVCEGPCPKQMPLLQFIWQIASGGAIWTIMEYILHRWVFHLDPGRSLLWMKLHFLLHGVHHKVPFDSSRLVFPPIPAAVLAYAAYTTLNYVLTYVDIKMIGGITGYLTYDMIHYYIHHGSPRDGSYLYMMKRYHANHHFVNYNKAFGISSKLWDNAFHTCVKLKKLNFSLRWN